ncbi:MAG: hypothetical protein COU46_02665 [Candidatus Niyogibacteria bacterium CG10_big_fil_rev_8_21_14_0_10_42_19]|uniref:Uncharacterized protein n=1 Tax=Candidatus Niyogibacteria bacterium CG10_big_fil_rev_8_21_14_0_10_42_19 TaxID=1974725 RepID=A0A2H0TFA7_9BACT|nr:MAG: hypothetical protein COU46_02665 [Candidatus Niyogibacteria bacterium CG10_big_fil_rev_8_21_14_0_10_42_19]
MKNKKLILHYFLIIIALLIINQQVFSWHMADNHGSLCPFLVMTGNACPPINKILASAEHQLSGAVLLTRAIFNNTGSVVLFIFILSAFLFAGSLDRLFKVRRPFGFLYKINTYLKESVFVLLEECLFWISLHNSVHDLHFQRARVRLD